MSCISEEVLNILNEPDREFDEPIDMTGIDINDVLEEEEVEYEFECLNSDSEIDTCILKNIKGVCANYAIGVRQPMQCRQQLVLMKI